MHVVPSEAGQRVGVQIDTETRYQVIEGFGASAAWWPTWVHAYPEEDQQRLMRLLYSDEGAGLDVYRYNIPAGAADTVDAPERRTPDIETSPGVYDFEADANGLKFLRAARELGVQHFVLFANSPPARMTRNGKTSGGPDGGSNLDPEYTEEFARYLVDVSEYLQAEFDLPYVTLSPINEPQWRWGQKGRSQEGCHYTPEETARTLRAVVDEVQRRGLDIRVEGPESGAWSGSQEYAQAVYRDPVLREHLDTFALHSYWSNVEKKQQVTDWFREHFPDITLSMTEYCEMRWGHGINMDEGLRVARVMHEDLTIGSVVTWQWWLAIAAGGYNDGLIYAGRNEQKIELTKRFWVMAHYARFVEPGSTRLRVRTKSEDLLASAYLTPEADRVVLVLTNPTDREMRAYVSTQRKDYAAPTSYWVTDEDRDLDERQTDQKFLTVPANSMVTAVLDRAAS